MLLRFFICMNTVTEYIFFFKMFQYSVIRVFAKCAEYLINLNLLEGIIYINFFISQHLLILIWLMLHPSERIELLSEAS
ncbi:TPA: hypothetical protein HNC37_25000 [Escherichia coli]|nr:hypothetical protein [Escherichia coli]